MDQQTRVLCTHNIQNEVDTYSYVQEQELSINTSIEGGKGLAAKRESTQFAEGALEIVEVELRKEGRAEFDVNKNYAAFSGWFITVVICLSAILMQASCNGNDLWLSYWVDKTGSSQVDVARMKFITHQW